MLDKNIIIKNYFFVFVFVLQTNLSLFGQIITTVAGGGSITTGEGVPATSFGLGICYSTSIDSVGTIYFMESETNTRLRMVNIGGNLYTVAGNGTTGFTGDSGLATNSEIENTLAKTDKKGNLYLADYYNNRVRKIDFTTHTINTIIGNGTASSTGDDGLAFNATIQPYDLCFDTSGNMYVVDIGRIRMVNINDTILTIAGTGVAGYSGDGGLATAAQITPNFICYCSYYNCIYFSDRLKIRKLNLETGIIEYFAGTGLYPYNGDGINADSANFRVYIGMACDSKGNLYFTDYGSQRIRVIDSSHIIHTIAGTGTAGFSGDGLISTSAQVNYPDGLAIDKCDNLYIADADNYRIRKITFPIASPTISIATGADSVCTGSSMTLNSSMIGASSGSASTYQWYVNGTAISGATNATYTYAPTGSDSVRCVLNYSSTCGAAVMSSNTINLTLVPAITPTISLPAGINYAAVGTVVTVNAALADTPATYTINWYNHGLWLATTTTSQLTYTKVLAVDSISAHLEGAEMCFDSAVSGMHVVIDSTLGIFSFSMVNTNHLNIYPNPAKDFLIIEAGKPMQVIAVLDMYGRVVYDKKSDRHNESIGIKELPAGLYFVQVDGVMAGKFLKE